MSIGTINIPGFETCSVTQWKCCRYVQENVHVVLNQKVHYTVHRARLNTEGIIIKKQYIALILDIE